jgi:adenine/guanine phosphoribosyltransferase-like PRPP-binding protein
MRYARIVAAGPGPHRVSAYWQAFGTSAPAPPFQHDFPARMPDGRFLTMKLRATGETAVADLILTQTSFLVLDALADWLARALRPLRPEVLLGLPIQGYTIAAETARRLSHPSWVPMSMPDVPLHDVATAAVAGRADGPKPPRPWLDPLCLPKLQGRRAVLVDDVLHTGGAVLSGLAALAEAGIRPIAVAVAMTQGNQWRSAWPPGVPLVSVFATALFGAAPASGGAMSWAPREETIAWDACPLFRHGMARADGPRLVGPPNEVRELSDPA